MKRINSFGLAGFLILILQACASGVIYEQTVSLPPEGWHKGEPAKFKVNISDTSQVIDVGFTFKHDNDYPYSNLWLFLNVQGPLQANQTDTLELFLARLDGEWLGRERGNMIEVSALFMNGVKMNQPGDYHFTVVQGMRRESLPGISSIELWVQESNY